MFFHFIHVYVYTLCCRLRSEPRTIGRRSDGHGNVGINFRYHILISFFAHTHTHTQGLSGPSPPLVRPRVRPRMLPRIRIKTQQRMLTLHRRCLSLSVLVSAAHLSEIEIETGHSRGAETEIGTGIETTTTRTCLLSFPRAHKFCHLTETHRRQRQTEGTETERHRESRRERRKQ